MPADASDLVRKLGSEYGRLVALHHSTPTFVKHHPFVLDFMRFMTREFPIWSGNPADLALPCWHFVVPVYCALLRRRYAHTVSQVGSACGALNFWVGMHDAEHIFNHVPATVCKSVERRMRSTPRKRSLGLQAWMVRKAVDKWFHVCGCCSMWQLQMLVWSMLSVLGLFRHKSSM